MAQTLDRAMPWGARLAAAAAVLVLVLRVLHAAYDKSPCNDEPKHLITGHTFLRTRLCCLGGNNTPMTAVYAIPEMVFGTPIRSESLPAVHVRYLRARLMNVPLLMLLAVAVFAFARRLFGWRGGLVALIFLCVEPNLAAHAALVSPDFQLAVFFPLAAIALGWLIAAPGSLLAVVVAGFAIGLAVLAKFSALALVPAFLIAPPLIARGGAKGRGLALLRALVALVIGYGVMQAVYEGPRMLLGPKLVADFGGLDRDLERLPYRVSELKVMLRSGNQGFGLLPGIRGTLSSVSEGYGTYLNGEVSGKRWLYYPEAVLLKTPLPLMLAFAWGVVVLVRRRRFEPTLLCLLLASTLLVVGAMSGNLQLGVRHLLPLYPVLCVVAGACALQDDAERLAPWRRAYLFLLIAFAVFEGVRHDPDHLAYFNQLAGGSSGGARYLAADNLDWGQDLRGLRKYQIAQRMHPLALRYFGSVPPYRYDIDFVDLTDQPVAGWIAISRTSLVSEMRSETPPGAAGPRKTRTYAWLDHFEPAALIGDSIAVYHLGEDDLQRAGLR
jgi:hypothetical protein